MHNENVRRAATMSHKVLFLKYDCPVLVFYITIFFHGDILIRALFSKEMKVINTSTCPKHQYPLFCSQLANGQKYLPNRALPELYSIYLILVVKEHNCTCSFVRSHLGWIYKWHAVPQRHFSAFYLYLLVLEAKYSWLGKTALPAFLHRIYLWNAKRCGDCKE